MSEYKYILEPYKGMKTRYACPNCGQKHRFTRYINTDTKEYISEKVGRCDRESNCNYHYTPSSFFTDNPSCNTVTFLDHKAFVPAHTKNTIVTHVTNVTPIQYLPLSVMDKTVTRHRQCSLYPFLLKLFRENVATWLCENYFIGASKDNHTTFWQVDVTGKIRQAKVMQYDPVTGRRNKDTGAFFAGKKILNNDEANLQQCFFGEYLLSMEENKKKPVAIAESEKTALIASVYYPDFVWLATGGKYGCKWTEQSVCKVLKGRKVILFPDLGAFDNWKTKSLLLAAVAGCKVAVSDSLERLATDEERMAGYDIADYLLRNEYSSALAMADFNYPVIWDYSTK